MKTLLSCTLKKKEKKLVKKSNSVFNEPPPNTIERTETFFGQIFYYFFYQTTFKKNCNTNWVLKTPLSPAPDLHDFARLIRPATKPSYQPKKCPFQKKFGKSSSLNYL